MIDDESKAGSRVAKEPPKGTSASHNLMKKIEKNKREIEDMTLYHLQLNQKLQRRKFELEKEEQETLMT